MRNLFVLLLRYHALILFIGLEVISLSLVFSKNSFQRSAILNATQEVVGYAQNTFFEVDKFLSLGKVNDSLANEIAQLKAQLQGFEETPDSAVKIQYTIPAYYEFIPAKVIGNSSHQRNNYITLDAGAYDGVEKNMAVVSSKGVVGILKGVSGSFSSGISVLHSDFAVGARIKDLNENGTLVWDGENPEYAILTDIPGHVNVQANQEVEVNAFSFIFPEGTPIGRVVDYELDAGKAFYKIRVKLHDNFRNLNYVYVVKNLKIDEKNQLESKIKD
ncbi:rod shape-determining protein MreC [bacterium]|nr:rod shape-determining protein MreC [bacterium]